MSTIEEQRASSETEAQPDSGNPFAEVESRAEDISTRAPIGFLPWTENLTPFAEGIEASHRKRPRQRRCSQLHSPNCEMS